MIINHRFHNYYHGNITFRSQVEHLHIYRSLLAKVDNMRVFEESAILCGSFSKYVSHVAEAIRSSNYRKSSSILDAGRDTYSIQESVSFLWLWIWSDSSVTPHFE